MIVNGAHCFLGVHDEIQKHLLQLDLVADDHRQPFCELGMQRDVLALKLGMDQRGCLSDNLVDVQPNLLRWRFCSERARIRFITSLARIASLIMRSTARRAASISATLFARYRRHAFPLLTSPVKGWFISCAIVAVSSPIVVKRLI